MRNFVILLFLQENTLILSEVMNTVMNVGFEHTLQKSHIPTTSTQYCYFLLANLEINH